MASQGRLRSPPWIANKLVLIVHNERKKEELGLDLHIVRVKKSTPAPQPDDFVPWTPEFLRNF